MSVLGAHTQSLLKPSALQHWLRGTSAPPFVARHTKALLELENLLVGSSSCSIRHASQSISTSDVCLFIGVLAAYMQQLPKPLALQQ